MTKNGSLQVVVWSRSFKKVPGQKRRKQSVRSKTFTVYGWRRDKLFRYLKDAVTLYNSQRSPNPLIKPGKNDKEYNKSSQQKQP